MKLPRRGFSAGRKCLQHAVPQSVERLFEIESHPVVEFVVQGTDRHRAFMLRTSCHDLNLLRMRTLGSAPQFSLLPPDGEMFSFRGRRAPRSRTLKGSAGPPLTFGSLRM